jgi:uncharacterized protein YdhG (YjbR/CyaY superfamily)
MAAKPKTVNEYLAGVAGEQRTSLEQLRRAVRAAVPDAEEGFSYGMPALFLNGKAIAGFAAFTNHLSYFPMSGRVVESLADDLRGFQTSKGAIQFQPDKPLSAALVRKLVKARLAEIGETRGKAEKPRRVARSPAAAQTDPAVDTFLRDLDHPLKADYVTVRKWILGIDPTIHEGIKWNAPSFRTADYFATLFLRTRDRVQLIFHTGAKGKGVSMKDRPMPDPNGLVQWLAADRCTVTLGRGSELKGNRKPFEAFAKSWIRHLKT